MNRINYRYIIFFVVALFLQINIIKYVEIATWKPDLVLVAIVMFALQYGASAGSTAGFLTGLTIDLISGGLLGISALTHSIVGYAAATISKYFQEKSRFIITLFICGFINEFLYTFIDTLGKKILWQVIVFVHIIPTLFYTALIGFIIHFMLGKWLEEYEQY